MTKPATKSLHAVAEYVVLLPIVGEEKTAGGILIPSNAGILGKFKVVSAGAKVFDVLGVGLLKGDIVYAHKDDGFAIDGGKRIISCRQIFGIEQNGE